MTVDLSLLWRYRNLSYPRYGAEIRCNYSIDLIDDFKIARYSFKRNLQNHDLDPLIQKFLRFGRGLTNFYFKTFPLAHQIIVIFMLS